MREKQLITDEEWKKYLEDCYSHVTYGLPTKDIIEKFLKWREIKINPELL